MYTSGQMINYNKYYAILKNTPAPIMGDQLPNVRIDLAALMQYARERGVKAGELTDEEKNRFIVGDTVESLHERVKKSVQYNNLVEWNAARENMKN